MEKSELEHVENIKEAPIMFKIVSIENSSPHWHYEYEVFFVLKGSVIINCEAGSFDLGKGDMLLINSQEIHSIIPSETGNLCLFMQWSPALLLDVYESRFCFNLKTVGEKQIPPEKASLFRNVLVQIGLLLHEKPDGYQFTVKSWFYGFIGLLFSDTHYTVSKPDKTNTAGKHLEDFDKIQQYIREHFKEELTIDRLCSEVAMSRAKVFRILKMSGADSVKKNQKFYQVEYAKNLLVHSDLSIPWIAEESGFESESSFYRVFKEMTGLPPKRYRVFPGEKTVLLGVQGYAAYQQAEAVKLLKEFCLPVIMLLRAARDSQVGFIPEVLHPAGSPDFGTVPPTRE
ncbi:MAG: AraC family transcriptional regulator [Treponema sp.]|nr:AraC family transcriptional regulator [Treponema sp.]